eukprot:579880-Prymnesium_polylepis.1
MSRTRVSLCTSTWGRRPSCARSGDGCVGMMCEAGDGVRSVVRERYSHSLPRPFGLAHTLLVYSVKPYHGFRGRYRL